MITVNCEKFNPKIDKSYESWYSKIVNRLNIPMIECSCHQRGTLKIHAYYSRSIKTPFGKVKIRILRVICSFCHRTHAILPMFIVPYSQIQMEDQINIILNDLSSDIFQYDEIDFNTIYRIKSNYIKYFKFRLISENIVLNDYGLSELSKTCIHLFKRQFMQIHRGNIIYFSSTT